MAECPLCSIVTHPELWVDRRDARNRCTPVGEDVFLALADVPDHLGGILPKLADGDLRLRPCCRLHANSLGEK
jgi:hypothetical protein